MSTSRFKWLIAGICFVLSVASAHGTDPIDRPNKGKKLYAPPWEDELAKLANSCAGIGKAECETVRRLYTTPHAHVIGISPPLSSELRELHGIIRDALAQKKVPTIVLYSFPNRDCGGGVPTEKVVNAEDYKHWIDQISGAMDYYGDLSVNIIVEPGGLANVVLDTYKLCNERKRSDILAERIDLIRYVSWSFAKVDRKGKRLNPKTRLFVDVGNPDRISGAQEKLAIANALERVLAGADFDGVSVSSVSDHSFDESVAWAKQLIALIRVDASKRLTIAVDIGRSGNKVAATCNAKGMALDTLTPTLDHPDPRVELVIVMSVPGEAYGDGVGCDRVGPLDNFDLGAFMEYLRNTSARETPVGK